MLSWYHDALPFPAVAPRLEGDARADVCVVGGGLMGVSAALHAAQAGLSVILLEGDRIGNGASGKAGGLLLPGYTASQTAIARNAGEDVAQALWRLSVDSLDQIKSLVAEHAIACDWRQGALFAALNARHLAAAAAEADEAASRWGYEPVEMLDQAALAAHIASDRYVGGYIDWRSAHVNPLALTRGLAGAAMKAGAQLCERSEVTSVDVNAGIARTRHGKVTAGQLILATNAATEMLVPDLGRYLLPATTFMVATEVLGEPMVSALLPTDLAVTDSAFVMDYFRRSSDHRLLFGGGVSYFGAEPLSIATMLKQRLIKVFPHLADYEVNLAWAGKLDITMNRMLYVRRLGRQCWTAFGFSGHGLALSVGVGAKLGTLGRHGEGSIAALEAVRHRAFPGGRWLRAPATTVGVKALQAWDWLRR